MICEASIKFVPEAAFSKLKRRTLIVESSDLNAFSALFLRSTFLLKILSFEYDKSERYPCTYSLSISFSNSTSPTLPSNALNCKRMDVRNFFEI